MKLQERVKSWEKTKKVTIELNEFEVTEMLKVLGAEQNRRYDNGQKAKTVEFLISKIYRAMGIKL